jgi:hypothetical protein
VTALSRGRTRVTVKDVANNGGIQSLIEQLVAQASGREQEAREAAAGMLSSLASQNHGEHLGALYNAGAVPPLVRILKDGTAKAQECASKALHALVQGKPEHQAAMVECGAVAPLVMLLRAGSAKVQEEVRVQALRPSSQTHHRLVTNGQT